MFAWEMRIYTVLNQPASRKDYFKKYNYTRTVYNTASFIILVYLHCILLKVAIYTSQKYLENLVQITFFFCHAALDNIYVHDHAYKIFFNNKVLFRHIEFSN